MRLVSEDRTPWHHQQSPPYRRMWSQRPYEWAEVARREKTALRSQQKRVTHRQLACRGLRWTLSLASPPKLRYNFKFSPAMCTTCGSMWSSFAAFWLFYKKLLEATILLSLLFLGFPLASFLSVRRDFYLYNPFQPPILLLIQNSALESGNLQTTLFIQIVDNLFESMEKVLGLPRDLQIGTRGKDHHGLLSDEQFAPILEIVMRKEEVETPLQKRSGGVKALRRSITEAKELLRDSIAP